MSVAGGLLVDKPTGPTSHDAVARIRRALGTRRVGHAGTLDPMASGLLVVLVGEATKLAPYLSGHDKRYRARVVLGVGTDTFDAAGAVTATAPIDPEIARELAAIATQPDDADLGRHAPRLAAALDAERNRIEQVPPAHSAIHIGGVRSYDLARRGEQVELPPRSVRVLEAHVVGASGSAPPYLDVELLVSKGYYVRSFARDFGARLGVPAHLSALRRIGSGPMRVDDAVPLDAPPDLLRTALVDLPKLAEAALPVAHLRASAIAKARNGQRLTGADFLKAPESGAAAWLAPTGELVAIGTKDAADGYAIERGFTAVSDPARRK